MLFPLPFLVTLLNFEFYDVSVVVVFEFTCTIVKIVLYTKASFI